jgi:hypothetical protein
MRLSALDAQAVAAIDPRQVRLRVSVPRGFVLDVPASRLTLAAKLRNGTSREDGFTLSQLAVTDDTRGRSWFSDDVAVRTWTFGLAAEGQRALAAFQQYALDERLASCTFSVNIRFAASPPAASEVTFWTDLQLSEREGFLVLIDGATVHFETP